MHALRHLRGRTAWALDGVVFNQSLTRMMHRSPLAGVAGPGSGKAGAVLLQHGDGATHDSSKTPEQPHGLIDQISDAVARRIERREFDFSGAFDARAQPPGIDLNRVRKYLSGAIVQERAAATRRQPEQQAAAQDSGEMERVEQALRLSVSEEELRRLADPDRPPDREAVRSALASMLRQDTNLL